MKALLFLLAIIFFTSSGFNEPDDPHYFRFLKEQNKTAKEYIISLFKNNDVVILCERDHKEFTQYELFLEVVKDPYFIKYVGHIFTEVGVVNMDRSINKFLQSKHQDSLSTRKKITSIFRDLDSSPYWHCYSYPWFLGQLFKINQNLNYKQKLALHPSDCEFDWNRCKTAEQYKVFENSIQNRDSIMAANIIKKFDLIRASGDTRKKALVIMNYKHAFLKDHKYSGETLHNTGRYLSEKYKNRVASVYIMGLAIPRKGAYTVVKNGRWDYLFEESKKTDVGFDLKNSPFGFEDFDATPPDSTASLKYKDFFTGILFYKPLTEHKLKTGWADFATSEFIPELRRRTKIFNDAMDLGMSPADIEKSLVMNNFEKTLAYPNIESLKREIYKNRTSKD